MMKRRTVAAALALSALASASCAINAPEKTKIGMARPSLDLVFSDEKLKVDIPPNILVQYLPALPDDLASAFPGTPVPTLKAPPNPFACPKAPDDAPVSDVAPAAITDPPVAGTYAMRNVGTLKIQGGPVAVTLPYPPVSLLLIRDVKVEDVADVYAGTVRKTSFVSEDQITPSIKIVSTYQYDAGELSLIKRETVNNGQITGTFTPAPAVEVFRFTGPQGSWNSAGIDLATDEALVVQGRIGPREPVDVCGTLVDTLPASTDENQVDAASGQRSGSRAGEPTITNYATQFGGLPARREQHTSQIIQTDSGPITLDTDVVSTLFSTSPIPPELLR